jgi:hypothetical protein
MPRLLDNRVVGGGQADVVNRNYAGAQEGWVLAVDSSLQNLVLTPQAGPTGPVGTAGMPGPAGSTGPSGAPGSLSAWGTFALNTQTWIGWHNIASVELVQSGRLRFNFAVPLPTDRYSVVATTWVPNFNTGGGGNDNIIRVNGLTTNSFELTWLDRNNLTLENPSGVSFMVLHLPVPEGTPPLVVTPAPPPPAPPPDPGPGDGSDPGPSDGLSGGPGGGI